MGLREPKGEKRVPPGALEQRIRRCLFVIAVLAAGSLPACGTSVDDGGNGLPTPEEALETYEYKITTSTRRVYTNDVEDVDDVVTLHGFYSYSRDGWVWNEQDLTFDRGASGEVEVVRKGSPDFQEAYVLPGEGQLTREENLTTVAWWEGDSPRQVTFSATEVPWVINAGYTSTSRADSAFRFTVTGSGSSETSMSAESGVHYMVMDEAGTFTISLQPTACRWWLQVGVE